MQITRSSLHHAKGPEFTGDVSIATVAAPTGLSRARAALVHFTPGARIDGEKRQALTREAGSRNRMHSLSGDSAGAVEQRDRGAPAQHVRTDRCRSARRDGDHGTSAPSSVSVRSPQ